MDYEQPVETVSVVVAVDAVAAGGLMAHLLRDSGTGEREAVCGTAGQASFVAVELDWARLPDARRCPRCHIWAGVSDAC